MTTINLNSTTISTTTPKKLSESVTAPTTESTSQSKRESDTLTISGRSLMLSRLFHTDDPNAKPVYLTRLTTDNLTGNGNSFLNYQDRQLIERAYEFAQSEGIDFVQVDALAFDLAHYRFMQNNGSTGEQTSLYDHEGNPWVGKYHDQDKESARQILTSEAITRTDIDKDFLAYITNPQRSGTTKATSFDALEKFISGLSFQPSSPDNDGSPRKPTHSGLAQALYRLDNPYQGEKIEIKRADNSKDDPFEHLNEKQREQLLSAYMTALSTGNAAAMSIIDQMGRLMGIANMQELQGSDNIPELLTGLLTPNQKAQQPSLLLRLLSPGIER